MSGINYAEELYKLLLRDLVKDIVRELSENPKETLESEMEYIRKRFEDKRAGFLFESVLNEKSYWDWMNYQSTGIDLQENSKILQEVDFSSIRENGKNTKDIVWILIRTIAKYPRGEEKTKKETLPDKISYRQFEQLLEKIGFTNEEKELFRYHGDTFYFNGLIDNGDMIYTQNQESIVSHDCIMAGMNTRADALFKNTLKESNLDIMHGKLREVITDYRKLKNRKKFSEVDVQTIIQIAEKLSDLVPIIDRDSKLKNEKQLRYERIRVRLAVLTNFFLQGKNIEGKMIEEWEKDNLRRYFEYHIFIETFLGELYGRSVFSNKQMLVITEAYLHLQEQNLKRFKNKIEQYKGICQMISDKDYPIQIYRDAWRKIWNDGNEDG